MRDKLRPAGSGRAGQKGGKNGAESGRRANFARACCRKNEKIHLPGGYSGGGDPSI